MASTALVQARVEPGIRDSASAILAECGLDIPTAIRMFLTKVTQVGGIPFEVRSYNAETLAAMEEANRIAGDPTTPTYSSFSELLAHLDDDE